MTEAPTDERVSLLSELIRDVPDFPKPGILFKDITPLLADAAGFRIAVTLLEELAEAISEETDADIDVVVGMESRGFIFGAALANAMGVGFVPVRKPGRLPGATKRVEYELEYGTDALEIHEDAFEPGAQVLVVDDLIATGGTAAATEKLITDCGGVVAGFAFLIDLASLEGAKKLSAPVRAILKYD